MEESSDWFFEAIKEVSNINRQLWRFNHLPLGLSSSTFVNRERHEVMCSRLAAALYNLSNHFSKPQLGFVLWQHHDVNIMAESDTNSATTMLLESNCKNATGYHQTFCWSIATSMFDSIDRLHHLIEQRNGLPEYAMIEVNET
mmetsp:Transcript_18809/g.21228  ORF Transcript_18809/g.21228 Transcript_18809/m.21228 type:complete len:143 (-) Transcript_18809:65-493(-)